MRIYTINFDTALYKASSIKVMQIKNKRVFYFLEHKKNSPVHTDNITLRVTAFNIKHIKIRRFSVNHKINDNDDSDT